jgi:hypothetical protein
MGFFPYMGGILWGFLTFMEGFPIPPLSRGRSALHHAVYHVGCTICPEPYVVQDRVQDKALNLTWFRGGGWGIYVAVVLTNCHQRMRVTCHFSE